MITSVSTEWKFAVRKPVGPPPIEKEQASDSRKRVFVLRDHAGRRQCLWGHLASETWWKGGWRHGRVPSDETRIERLAHPALLSDQQHQKCAAWERGSQAAGWFKRRVGGLECEFDQPSSSQRSRLREWNQAPIGTAYLFLRRILHCRRRKAAATSSGGDRRRPGPGGVGGCNLFIVLIPSLTTRCGQA